MSALPEGFFQDSGARANTKCTSCPAGYEALRDSKGSQIDGAPRCQELNYILKCTSGEQYLNDAAGLENAKCEDCPPGAACANEKAAWSNLGPLFGWWKIPESERNGNINWRSTRTFEECPYPPACLGGPNRALEKRYYSLQWWILRW